MDLKHFNSLAINSPTEAINFMNLLIAHFPREEDKGKAILEIYEAFSDDIKNKQTIFSSVFHNFFVAHKITKENNQYYEQFSQYWNNSEKEEVKKNNSHWNFPQTTFKDAVEFAKSFKKYNSEPFENTYSFLSFNKEEINRLINLDKNKFSIAMLKNKGWSYLFENNYEFFTNFCAEYKYDEINIVQALMGGEESFGFKKYITNDKTDPKSISFILDNMDKIFEDSYFFTLYSDDDENYNIADTFLTFIIQGRNEFAFKLAKEHRKQLNDCLFDYMFSFGYKMEISKADITKDETWEALSSILDRIHHFKESAYYSHNFTIKPLKYVIKAIKSIPKVIECEEMKDSLNNHHNLPDKKRIKI
jgi:hypothetical protein